MALVRYDLCYKCSIEGASPGKLPKPVRTQHVNGNCTECGRRAYQAKNWKEFCGKWIELCAIFRMAAQFNYYEEQLKRLDMEIGYIYNKFDELNDNNS